MKRVEELAYKSIERGLSDEEDLELALLLEQDQSARHIFLDILNIEAALRGELTDIRIKCKNAAQKILDDVYSDKIESAKKGVLH